MNSLFVVPDRDTDFVVTDLMPSGAGGVKLVGEIITAATQYDVEILEVSLDCSQLRMVKRQGQDVTGTGTVRVLDSSGVESTDLVVTDVTIGNSTVYGIPNSQVNFELQNVNAGLAGGTPAPVNYLITIPVMFSGGSMWVLGLNVQVEAPPGTMKVPC